MRDEAASILYRYTVVENLDLAVSGDWDILMPLIPAHPKEFLKYSNKMTAMFNIFYERVLCEPINVTCPTAVFNRMNNSIRSNPLAKRVMVGKNFKPRREQHVGKIGTQDIKGLELAENGILQANYEEKGSTNF